MTNTKRKIAGGILAQATQAVTTVRGNQHGDAEGSFRAIGEMWVAYLNALSVRQTGLPLPGLAIMPRDVAYMMGHVKEVRVMFGDEQQADHYADHAGYVSLAGMFHVPERSVVRADAGGGAAPEYVAVPDTPAPIPEFLAKKV